MHTASFQALPILLVRIRVGTHRTTQDQNWALVVLIGPSLRPILKLVTHAWRFSPLVVERSLTCLLVSRIALDQSMEGSLQLYYPVSLACVYVQSANYLVAPPLPTLQIPSEEDDKGRKMSSFQYVLEKS